MNGLPESFKMTELGALPEEWDVVRLGDVTEKTKQKDPRKTPEWKFKYVDVSSISRGTLKITECKLCQGKDAPSRAKKLVKRNDIIFATVRPTLKRLTLIDEEFDGEICSTAFCILRATEHILNPLYLFYAVQRDVFIDEFEKVQRGASYPAITDSDVKNQSIPLPPLPEQHRIAAVLSAVQDAKEKTGAVIAAAKSLKKSLMRHLFTYGPVPAGAAERVPLAETEIGLVPEGWDVVRLGEVAKIKYGKANPKDTGNVPVVGSGGIYSSTTNPLVDYPTIIIGRKGTAGKVWLFLNSCYPSDTTFYLEWKGDIDVSFLFNYMASNPLSGEHAKTTLPSLQKPDLENYPIPLPPPPTQRKIANILSTADKKIEAEENKKKALDELFKALLHNLMTGKIRVNNLEVRS